MIRWIGKRVRIWVSIVCLEIAHRCVKPDPDGDGCMSCYVDVGTALSGVRVHWYRILGLE